MLVNRILFKGEVIRFKDFLHLFIQLAQQGSEGKVQLSSAFRGNMQVEEVCIHHDDRKCIIVMKCVNK